PLHGTVTVQVAAPAPKLTYRKGPLIAAVEVFVVFWGDAWKSAPQNAMIPKIEAFFDFILASVLMDQLAEYNTSKITIGHGRRTGTATIAGKLASSVTDTSIQTFIRKQITAGRLPKTTGNTLYFVYMPPGVRVVMGGSSSCQAFCGYHNASGTKIFYA